MLARRYDLLKGVPHEPLLVIGPRELKRYLEACQKLEDLDMQFLDCRSTTEASWDTLRAIKNQIMMDHRQKVHYIRMSTMKACKMLMELCLVEEAVCKAIRGNQAVLLTILQLVHS